MSLRIVLRCVRCVEWRALRACVALRFMETGLNARDDTVYRRNAPLTPSETHENKKLRCRRETARCIMSLNILLTHSRSLKVLNDILFA